VRRRYLYPSPALITRIDTDIRHRLSSVKEVRPRARVSGAALDLQDVYKL